MSFERPRNETASTFVLVRMLRRFNPVHGLHRLHGLGQLHHITAPIVGITRDVAAHGPWRHAVPRRQRGPSVARMLLAGLAIFAFMKLTSAADARDRSRAERLLLGALMLVVGGIILWIRRSARRHRW